MLHVYAWLWPQAAGRKEDCRVAVFSFCVNSKRLCVSISGFSQQSFSVFVYWNLLHWISSSSSSSFSSCFASSTSQKVCVHTLWKSASSNVREVKNASSQKSRDIDLDPQFLQSYTDIGQNFFLSSLKRDKSTRFNLSCQIDSDWGLIFLLCDL